MFAKPAIKTREYTRIDPCLNYSQQPTPLKPPPRPMAELLFLIIQFFSDKNTGSTNYYFLTNWPLDPKTTKVKPQMWA